MSRSLLSRPSTLFRLNGLCCGDLRRILLCLHLSLRIFRLANRRCSSGRFRFPAIVTEEREGGEAAVKRQYHLASFDLADLPAIDLVADLCAYQFLVRA